MKQVVPHALWLGHAGEGRDFRALFDAGIRALVELAMEEAPSQPPREFLYFRFPLLDGDGNDAVVLDMAVTTVANLIEKRVPTLVCCDYGLSRAPAVSAAALAMVYQEAPEETLKKVAAHHGTDVTPGLWNEVVHFLASARR